MAPPCARTLSSSMTGIDQGRGAASNRTGRFEAWSRAPLNDGWSNADRHDLVLRTTLAVDASRSIICYNRSPDVPFDRSINPYRGCEHGCIYCFARPSHAWLGLSPGLDFESRLIYKPQAAALLAHELADPRYRCATITLGANTDPYQPVERKLALTRRILELLHRCCHPVAVVTKSALVERDLDILADMARQQLATVAVSITTLDCALARRLEPRAAAPKRRLGTIERLSAAGVPVTLLVAPVIPVLTDGEMETIMQRGRAAGARSAGYTLLRLPLEVRDLFREWLDAHFPSARARICKRIRETQGGKDYDATFGARMRGTGEYAKLIAQRFALACKRLGFADDIPLDSAQFQAPAPMQRQLSLF